MERCRYTYDNGVIRSHCRQRSDIKNCSKCECDYCQDHIKPMDHDCYGDDSVKALKLEKEIEDYNERIRVLTKLRKKASTTLKKLKEQKSNRICNIF